MSKRGRGRAKSVNPLPIFRIFWWDILSFEALMSKIPVWFERKFEFVFPVEGYPNPGHAFAWHAGRGSRKSCVSARDRFW